MGETASRVAKSERNRRDIPRLTSISLHRPRVMVGTGHDTVGCTRTRRRAPAIADPRSLPHHLRVPDVAAVRHRTARAAAGIKNVLEEAMNRSRRRLLAGSLAFVPLALAGMRAQAQSTTLK